MKYTLKELRAKHNFSQAYMAKELNVSVQVYDTWERDFGRIKISKANEIAQLLGVTLDDIFFCKRT